MKEWASKHWKSAVIYRIVIVKCILFTISTFGAALQTACVGVDYATLSPWTKFLLWVGVLTIWSQGMQMFIDKGVDSIQKGKIPFIDEPKDLPPTGSGNTEIIKKQTENG